MFARVAGGFLFAIGAASSAGAQVPLPNASVPPGSQVTQVAPAQATTVKPVVRNDTGTRAGVAGAVYTSPMMTTPTIRKPLVGSPVGTVTQASQVVPMAQPANPMATPNLPPTATSAATSAYGACTTCDPCQTCASCQCYPQCSCAWANVEWLYWAAAGQSLPPLVTTAPAGPAALGAPGTVILAGNSRANNDFRSGFRANAGFWLDDDHRFGIEMDFFFLGDSGGTFAASGTGAAGTATISRPFFNVITGLQDTELVAAAGTLAGTVTVTPQSQVIGGGVNLRHNLCCNPCGRVDLIYGYRYFNLQDDLTITEDLLTTAATPLIPAGTRFQIRDHFGTNNNFNGGVLGIAAERQFSYLVVGVRASVALGANNQIVYIDGSTTTTPPGGLPTTLPGGLLTQTSNIGRYETTTFAVMPEFGLKLGVQVTDHLQIYGGYNFIYLSNVVRAGDQVNLNVNPNLLPPGNGLGGPAQPSFVRNTTDFWMQGFMAGVGLRY